MRAWCSHERGVLARSPRRVPGNRGLGFVRHDVTELRGADRANEAERKVGAHEWDSRVRDDCAGAAAAVAGAKGG